MANLQKASKSESWRWFWSGFDAHLQKRGLKQTRQRRQLIEIFLDLGGHQSAEAVHEAARNARLKIGLATVYRTLSLLTDSGLVAQKSFGDGRQVYEVVEPGAHHDHIICRDCGVVVEFENEAIEALQEKVAKELGFELVGHRLDLFGRCRRPGCERRTDKA